MPHSTILTGNVLDVLPTLPEQSVNCVVTSPPYWGLRDYGTATWEGGSPACDHKPGGESRVGKTTLQGGNGSNGHKQEGYKTFCAKCGARRIDRQIGMERTPTEYVSTIVEVFRQVWRVLAADGTVWLNLGDTYASAWACDRRNVVGNGSLEHGKREDRPNRLVNGLKEKDLVGIPWRVAFGLQEDGWYLRSDIIWAKPNNMPESVTDRPTKAHEYMFLLTKRSRYYYDAEAIKEPSQVWTGQAATFERTGPVADHIIPNQTAAQHRANRGGHNAFRGQGSNRESENGAALREGRDMTDVGSGPTRNRRSVWTVATIPYPEAHFATFPPKLVEPCVLAGCPAGGVVLDPFAGSGTTLEVALRLGRDAIGIELNPDYVRLAEKRLASVTPALFGL